MGRGIALLSVMAGGFVCAVALGLLPDSYYVIRAPREIVAAGGAVLGTIGLLSLARDHRASETVTALLLLVLAGFSGWLTFYAPEGTLHQYVPFVPATVNDALARLLFGFGVAFCVGTGFFGIRRLLR